MCTQRRKLLGAPGTLVSIVLSILAVAACAGSTTSIEQAWMAPEVGQVRLQRVVAIYIGEDGTIRRSAEDRLAQRLVAQGVQAVQAYAVLSSDDIKDLDRAKAKLRAAGFDGVVAMRMVDKETEIEYVPGTFDGYWGTAWPYYGYGYGSPGYLYSEVVVRIETTAYSLYDNKLVWSALSKTIDPYDTGELVDDVTKVVANELGRRGVVVATRAPRPPLQG